jgi:hypothetical protein
MTYNYEQKGIWRVKYQLAANDNKFIELNKCNWNQVMLEENLKRGDFKEANEVIEYIKNLK